MRNDYDVVVVGGRVAGASTAMLLARCGHRVLVVERKDGHVDLGHDLPQESLGLHGPEALLPENRLEGAHLHEGEAERVVGARTPCPDGVVPLPKPGQHVGEDLEGPDQPLP